MNRRRTVVTVAIVAATWFGLGWAAGEKGWFGLAVSVDAEGFSFNPTLRSVTVEKVFPASPAAQAGLAAGDVVLEVQGILVAGAKADALKAAMQKSVGEMLRLKVKRGSAEAREVSLTATARPAEP